MSSVMRLLRVALCLTTAVACSAGRPPIATAVQAAGVPLEVMTFNVRYAHTQPPDLWPDRLPVVVEMIERRRLFAGDVVGPHAEHGQSLQERRESSYNHSVKRKYTVVLQVEPDGGYVATVPALPGCVSQGDSREETLSNIREAAELWIEDCVAAGEAVPTEDGKEFIELVA